MEIAGGRQQGNSYRILFNKGPQENEGKRYDN